jgi:hypothetical protein
MHRTSLSVSSLASSPLPAARRCLSSLSRAAARSLPARVYPKGRGQERGIRSAKKSKKVTLIPPTCSQTLRPGTSRPRRFQRLPFSPYTSHFLLFTYPYPRNCSFICFQISNPHSQIFNRELIVPLLFRETITPFSYINQ